MEEPHANTQPNNPPVPEMNVVIWGCRKCFDYGKVFDSTRTKNFCGKCGGKLDTRNFTFRFGTD